MTHFFGSEITYGSLISAIAAYVPGYDIESRILRKTLARQCNLMAVLLLRTLCSTNRKKTLDDIVSAGIEFISPFNTKDYCTNIFQDLCHRKK